MKRLFVQNSLRKYHKESKIAVHSVPSEEDEDGKLDARHEELLVFDGS
jgi:hypothetical protein